VLRVVIYFGYSFCHAIFIDNVEGRKYMRKVNKIYKSKKGNKINVTIEYLGEKTINSLIYDYSEKIIKKL
jgi:hypothetical protein